MSKRYAWLLGVVGLVAIGLLVACGSKFNSATDGLVLVGSQGSALIQTFSFGLNNGSISGISNPVATTGLPSAIVLDPAGAYAYTIVSQVPSPGCQGGSSTNTTGIATFKVNSGGTMSAVGTCIFDPNPVALAMDSSGKFLFVAEGTNSVPTAPNAMPCPGTTQQYGICVYSIGSGGALTAVPSPFSLQPTVQTPNLAALAVTPTVFPGLVNGIQQAVCSGKTPPTAEYLYAVDSVNDLIWAFAVDTSTGALTSSPLAPPATGSVPAGIAVDACDRFVYVANSLSNNISAYSICTAVVLPQCPNADGSLLAVSGAPFSVSGGANGPGPLVVDPFGNYVYVLDTKSSQVSTFHISLASGSLMAGIPAVVATGAGPTSLAIRSDDNWLFVANFGGATLSQFSITPATGALHPLLPTTTDNYPWGVAVK